MIIGVDLRSLQTGHQYRGIGELVRRTLNEVLRKSSHEHEFIFFEYETSTDPKKFLEIPPNLKYGVKKLGLIPTDKKMSKADKIKRIARLLVGNPVPGANKCDVFLQYDFSLGVPSWGTKTVLFMHDLIPLIFWKDYFTSPITHFKNKAARTTLRTIIHNFEYKRTLRRSVKKAKKVLAISQNTKNDVVKYIGTSERKIKVIPLGVDENSLRDDAGITNFAKLPDKPFILFIGAADARRRIDDLIDAFNNLRARGHDLQLALVGENFIPGEKIKSPIAKRAIEESSYKFDILTLGYVDDSIKKELYKNAIAFVFPTLYEGFGIPILEAMLNKCPVITYENSSIPEVAGENAIFANDWEGIINSVERIMSMSKSSLVEHNEKAYRYANKFKWSSAGEKLYKELSALN